MTFVPISKVTYVGDDFRLDGYYYHADTTRPWGPKVFIHFYYKDGTRLFWQSSEYDINSLDRTLSRFEDYAIAEKKSKTIYPNHYHWSAFEVVDNQIKLKSWAAIENWKKTPIEETLTIVNDTLLIDQSVEPSRYWQFRQFAHKPDSSSSPIK